LVIVVLAWLVIQTAVRGGFAQLAEGLTASAAGAPIEAGYRMFSAPDMARVCRNARAADVKRLRPSSSQLELRVGRPFAYSNLRLVALNASGAVLPRVPIAIESEMWSDVLDVRSDHIGDGTVTPVRAGTIRLRFRTICDASGAETFITARVRR
jgi:hypothetical protein